jgi:hypothetical protein
MATSACIPPTDKLSGRSRARAPATHSLALAAPATSLALAARLSGPRWPSARLERATDQGLKRRAERPAAPQQFGASCSFAASITGAGAPSCAAAGGGAGKGCAGTTAATDADDDAAATAAGTTMTSCGAAGA